MNLSAQLNIIQRATKDNAMVIALQFIHVYDSRMQASDGRIVVDVPCLQLAGFEFSVHGTKFVKAVEACGGSPDTIEIVDGKLLIKRGKFKAKLPLYEGTYPRREFEDAKGNWIKVPGNLHDTLRAVLPFIGEDASRPWCCGALFKGGKIYATNNTSVVRGVLPFEKDVTFNLPSFTIKEMLAMSGEAPAYCYVDDVSVTFKYGWDLLIKTQLLAKDWPDIDKMLEAVPADMPSIHPDLLSSIDKVVSFCPDEDFQCIVFDGKAVATTDGATFAEVDGFDLPPGRYRASILKNVLGQALNADFSKYPNAIPFKTVTGLVGVFVGVRQ